ncbi:MAG: DUF5131 family protein, partial [Oscillospiraceae bacterium]|nr:DUF5131 family protein [Oscillospiraceae bacterium]
AQCAPADWGSGYENVVVCCTIENQRNADKKLSVFRSLPIKHKCITAQPLIERVDLESYLDGVELVVVGGESDREARPLDYSWVLDIRAQCIRNQVNFEFRQCGTHFIKDGRAYTLQTRDLCRQARLAGINYTCEAGGQSHAYSDHR